MRKASILLATVLLLMPAVATAQNNPPIADAGEDQSIYVGESIVLEGSATDPDNNAILGWLWTIEDLPAGSTPYFSDTGIRNPLFEPDVAGDYLLSLIAFDGLDWSLPDYVTISAEDILPPEAIADADVTFGFAPLTVNFDGSQSFSPQGREIIYYRWDFDDGSAGEFVVSPSHTYISPGVYEVKLTIEDEFYHQTDYDTIEITVEEAPPAWGEASVVRVKSASPTTGLGRLIALLIPIGVVLLLKGLRRK